MTQERVQQSNVHLAQGGDVRDVHGAILIENVLDLTQETEATEKHIRDVTQQLGKLFSNNIHGAIKIQNIFTDKANAQDGLSDDSLSRLRMAAEGIARTGADQTEANPFKFLAKILQLSDQGEEQIPICATFDTGSAENLVSTSVVERAAKLEDVRPAPVTSLRGASGEFLRPIGLIPITWSRNTQQSWQTDFLVMEDAPYDIVLGRKFMVAEGFQVLSDAVLVADHSRLSSLSKGTEGFAAPLFGINLRYSDELLQMEQNARLKDPQNLQTSSRREELDKARCEKRRQDKATSRMSATTTPGLLTPGASTPSYQQTSSINPSLRPTTGSSTPSYQRTPSAQSHAPVIVGPVEDGDAAQATQGAPEGMQSSSTSV